MPPAEGRSFTTGLRPNAPCCGPARSSEFDSTVGGLGGCPFAGQPKAAGNICTEELVLLCEEMGIDTGIDLDALIEVGRMAEEIVGHQLPGELIHAGSLDAFRRRAAA